MLLENSYTSGAYPICFNFTNPFQCTSILVQKFASRREWSRTCESRDEEREPTDWDSPFIIFERRKGFSVQEERLRSRKILSSAREIWLTEKQRLSRKGNLAVERDDGKREAAARGRKERWGREWDELRQRPKKRAVATMASSDSRV